MRLTGKIGLGTVQFGIPYGISNISGQTPSDEVSRILKLAWEEGIQILDTASAYGKAEEILGQNNIGRFKLISKFMPPETNNEIEDQLNQTLLYLKVSAIYGYLAHRPIELLNEPEHWRQLNELKAAGKIMKTGFSLNSPKELTALLDKGFVPDLIQVPYNYFDNRFELQMVQLKEIGCEIHTRSTFLQGLFFKQHDSLPAYFHEVKPFIKELQKRKTLSGALLKYVLQKPFVDTVIMGVENVRQLKENFQELKTAEDLTPFENSLSEKILIPSNWPQA